jgi:hypothetical protein
MLDSPLTRPFLTALDSRAAVKGSVDPLGAQAIWTHLGRKVVGNLTTVTSSIVDFTVLLLGTYLAEQIAEAGGPEEVETFLKWEQLAAYSRARVRGKASFRGAIRTRARLSEGTRVTLSTEPAHLILGSQKTYGVFGLYSNPARTSDLLEQDRPRLTPAARELVEASVVPMLADAAGKGARGLLGRLAHPSVRVDLEGRDAALAKAVAKAVYAHTKPSVRMFYREYLAFGGPRDRTSGRQRELALAFADTFAAADYWLNPGVVDRLIGRARMADHHELANALTVIRTCESALAPFAAMFSFALQRGGASLAEVARELSRAWGRRLTIVDAEGLARLEGELSTATRSTATAARLIEAAARLRAGDYQGALGLLLAHNKSVMEARGGAAWLEERHGRLHVRLRYDEGELPAREQLPYLWRHAYFLDSLRSIARAVGVA